MAILSTTSSQYQEASVGSPQKAAPSSRRKRKSPKLSQAQEYHQNGGYSSCQSGSSHVRHRSIPAPLGDLVPGMSGEFLDISPTCTPTPSAHTPLSRKVFASAQSLPGFVQMHKLPLRDFQEAAPSALGNNSSTPMPSFRPPSSSMASLSGSSEVSTQLSSLSRPGTGQIVAQGERPLSRAEARENNQEAVDWFRASHAINISGRSPGETKAFLAAARDRRSGGLTGLLRKATAQQHPGPVPEVPLKVEKEMKEKDMELESINGDDDVAAPAAAEEKSPALRPTQPAVTRNRSCLDPMLLYGARAFAAVKEQRPAQPAVVRKRAHSISGEGVSVGLGSSLFSRLRQRASTIE